MLLWALKLINWLVLQSTESVCIWKTETKTIIWIHQLQSDYIYITIIGIGDVTDYSLYPDEAYQLDWIRVYLEEWNRIHDPDTPVTQQDVRKMVPPS